MTKLFPKITVVTPSYNQADYLEDTILSVLGQEYPNLEYLIFDGASSDNSVEIIEKYAERLSFWVSEKDNGQSHAINKGFRMATGEVLLWLNSDDLLMPNVLHKVATLVEENGDGIYFGDCIHFKKTAQGLHCYGSNVAGYYQDSLLENLDYIIQPSSFWTRKVWELNGELDESVHYGFDWEWFLRAKANSIRFQPLTECISMYRIHDSHKSSTGGSKRQDEIQSIYSKYSPKKAELYGLLRHESYHMSKFKGSLLQKIYQMRGRELTFGEVIKKVKPRKYQKFSFKEINETSLML